MAEYYNKALTTKLRKRLRKIDKWTENAGDNYKPVDFKAMRAMFNAYETERTSVRCWSLHFVHCQLLPTTICIVNFEEGIASGRTPRRIKNDQKVLKQLSTTLTKFKTELGEKCFSTGERPTKGLFSRGCSAREQIGWREASLPFPAAFHSTTTPRE